MTVVHDITTKKCANCGREISILHPDRWAYKRVMKNVNIFWCSWSCLRQSEKEGKLDMKKLTLENKKEAVRIALAGGNPLEFIRMCGISNAAEAWGKIKNNLKEKDQKTWEKLPKRLPNPVMDRKKEKTEEAPADEVTKAAMEHPERPIVQIDGRVVCENMQEQMNKEYSQKMAEKPKRNHTLLRNSNYIVSAIRTGLGEFYYDKKFDRLDWRTSEGEEVSMSPSSWFTLYEMIPEIMGILEVDTDREE